MKKVLLLSQRCSWLLTAGILLGVWLGGCQPQKDNLGQNDDKPRVVSTSTIIADLTTQIGGDEIEHRGILQPGSDPHVYEPTPKDSVDLEKADLILYNGYNLEPGLIKLMKNTGNRANRVAVGEVAKPLDFEYKGQKEPDPHIWGDAQNAILMVGAIRDRLIELAPEDRAKFTDNAAQLIAKLKRLDSWIEEQIATIPADKRKLVTTHDAFQYYARAYHLEIVGTLIGISTEEQPSAQTVKNLADSIRQTKVNTIFAETTINPQLIQTVAEEAGVSLAAEKLYSDSIGAPGSSGDSYIKMLVANTKTIVEALGGKYREFKE